MSRREQSSVPLIRNFNRISRQRGLTSANVTAPSMTIPTGLTVADTTVDLLVVGSGTGLAAALAAYDAGLKVLIVEKSSYIGGSTAR